MAQNPKKYRSSHEVRGEYADTVAALGECYKKLQEDIPREIDKYCKRIDELRDEYKSAQNREKNVKIVKDKRPKIVGSDGQPLVSPEGPQAS